MNKSSERDYLLALTIAVKKFLNSFDDHMAIKEKGLAWEKNAAKLANWLEMENDRARYFGLRIAYRNDKKTAMRIAFVNAEQQ